MTASLLQASRGPGCYSAPGTATGLSRPSPAFQDKQDRFDRPLQSMVPPVHALVFLCFAPCPAAPSPGPKALAPKPLPQSPCPTPLPQSPCLPYDPLPSNHGPVLTALAWSAFYTPANLVPAFVACLVSKSTCPLAKTPFFTRPLALCGGPFALCCGLWPSVKHGAVVCQDPLIAGSG